MYDARLREECFSSDSKNGIFKNTDTFCELIFDGIMCWPATKAGELAVQRCPGEHSAVRNFDSIIVPYTKGQGRSIPRFNYPKIRNYFVVFFFFCKFQLNLQKNATKKCTDTGDWYVNKELNNTWTNYTECWTFFDHESAIVDLKIDLKNRELYLNWLPTIKIISETGYWISLFFLVVSLTVFVSIKYVSNMFRLFPRIISILVILQEAPLCEEQTAHASVCFFYNASRHVFAETIFIRGRTGALLRSCFCRRKSPVRERTSCKKFLLISNKTRLFLRGFFQNWICKAVTSARNYFTVANYLLLLMEGVYLHNLMFSTIFSNYGDVTAYCVLGWGKCAVFLFRFGFFCFVSFFLFRFAFFLYKTVACCICFLKQVYQCYR